MYMDMKKTLYVLISLVYMLAFASCSDDNDNPYALRDNVKIKKMDIFFSPAPSTGEIVVDAPQAIKAKSSATWCRVDGIDGNTVKLSADENNTLEGRSSVITIYSGEDSTTVTAQQEGLVFAIDATDIAGDDSEGSRSFTLHHNFDVDVTSTADWLTWSISNDRFNVHFDANNTGHVRKGYIKYNVAGTDYTITVRQMDFDKDIAGKYKIYCKDQTLSGLTFTLNKTSMTFDDYEQTWEGTYDEATGMFTANCGQKSGTPAQFISRAPHLPQSYSNFDVYVMWMSGSRNTGYYTPNQYVHYFGVNSGFYLNISFDYDEEKGKTIGSLSGKWGNLNIDGLCFGLFQTTNNGVEARYPVALQFQNAHFEK